MSTQRTEGIPIIPPQNEVAGKPTRKRGFGIPGSTGLTLKGGPGTGGSERTDGPPSQRCC